MRLMLYEWQGFMQRDIEYVLKKMNIEFRVFMYSFLSANDLEDSYFESIFSKALKEGRYEGVLSMNFWPVIAKCCYRLKIPYIAWIYDCPFIVGDKQAALSYLTNSIFMFDRKEYEKRKGEGFPVHHLCLGSNQERIDEIVITGEEQKRYQADVSFVGLMYRVHFPAFCNGLTEYERGRLESVLETQLRIYGAFELDSMIEGDLEQSLLGLPYLNSVKDSKKERMRLLLSKEITYRERFLLLYLLSMEHRVALYSNREVPELPKVMFRGTVDSYEEIHKVFRMSRINLNITLKCIESGIPLRAMEILSAGGFLLSNYQTELVENFRPDVDCVVYESVPDAIEKVRYYLAHEEERKEIAKNGHEASGRFTLQKQMERILDVVYGSSEGRSS